MSRTVRTPLLALAFLVLGMAAPAAADQYTVTDLGTLPGSLISYAQGINNAGQVVGSSGPTIPSQHAFLWQSGVMTDLGTLPGFPNSNAQGINNAGQVVGSNFNNTTSHAFLWQNGVMTDLGTLGGTSSYALGINNAGQVVGYSATPTGLYHAFLWQNGVFTDLGTLGGPTSFAQGINNAGQVVGSSSLANFSSDAFLWQNGVMTDLNDLLPPGSGWNLDPAAAVNDLGQIVGTGTINGQTHAFLLTPAQAEIPEPTSLWLLGLGLLGLVGYGWRRRSTG
jgi:probable HAF family extracellular repeat protein